MRSHGWLIIVLTALAASVQADTIHINFTIGGTKLGENTFESSPDGQSAKSVTKMTLGAESISELNLRWEGAKLAHYDLTDVSGPNKGAMMMWDAGKLKIRAPKISKDLDLKFETEAFFSNFHLQVLKSLLAEIKSTDEQAYKAYILEGGVAVTFKANQKTALPFVKEGKTVAIRRYRLSITGIEIEYVTDPSGNVVGVNVPSQKFTGVADGWEGIFKDPLAAYPELSQPVYGVKHLNGLKMKTRDGAELVADAAIPDKPGKYPVILVRTPYGRKSSMLGSDMYVQRGYAYVVQDVRGREESGGEWDPFIHEQLDGVDTVDWVAKQDWSDGNVGMIGGSYLGYVQWAAAVQHPKALKCIVPQVSPPDAFNNLPYDHGAFMLFADLWWLNLVKDKQTHMELAGKPAPGVKNLTNLPLSHLDQDVLGVKIPIFQKWLDRETMAGWKGYDHSAQADKVTIPVLHVSGWFDGDEAGTMLHWEKRRQAGLNDRQWLIYGPWEHSFNVKTSIGDINYGPDSVIEIDSTYLRFFDTYLKHKNVGWDKQPKVKAFLTGANRWLTLLDWPDAKASQANRLYLHSDGPANGMDGVGRLSDKKPGTEEPDRYTYNPAAAKVPKSLLNGSPLEADLKLPDSEDRQDSLWYRTAALTSPLTLMAPIRLDLYFKTSAKDTDFFAILFDEDEKGARHLFGQAARFRASYMNGNDKRVLLTPDKLYHVQLRLWDVAHQIAKGHRLGLIVASDDFPGFARNLNTGEPIKNATRMVAASQTILHDAEHPTSLTFWSLKQ